MQIELLTPKDLADAIENALTRLQHKQPEEEAFTPEEAAAFIKVHVNTLSKWRNEPGKSKLPAYGKGNVIRYLKSDLIKYLKQHPI